jgi:hypothetical protein
MSEMRVHFRHLMLYEFRKRNTATNAANNICAVYGKGVLSARTCRKWFDRFQKRNFNLQDEPRAGRSVEAGEDRIRNLVNETRSLSAREMSQMLNISKSCAKIAGKRPRLINCGNVISHHDNARPHVAQNVQKKLREFGWEILSHPPYSLDIAPSDFSLFRSLQQFLAGKKFNNVNAIENAL